MRVLILAFFITFLGSCKDSMGNSLKRNEFSHISGTILLDGQPVAGARIKRVIEEKKVDETNTDDKG